MGKNKGIVEVDIPYSCRTCGYCVKIQGTDEIICMLLKPTGKYCGVTVAYERCEVYQVKRFTESEAVKERIKIQNLNSQKGMYAGYIAALRKDAKITMLKMSQIAGCSPAEYSSYEHEKKEFDPEIYRKCEKYLKEKEGEERC